MKSALVGLGLLLSFAPGCYEDYYQGVFANSLRARAGYDFRCPKSQLRLTDLTPLGRRDGVGSVFGVDGCGRRATYVYSQDSIWIMNSDEHRDEKSAQSSDREE